MKITLAALFFFLFIALACTKQIGVNPSLAYSDRAILDSIKQPLYYYKNNASVIYPGTGAPHGAFKLRFNSVAAQVLTDGGKLPAGGVMPDGSLVVKDVYKGGEISLYAIMYKHGGAWRWGEITPSGRVEYSLEDKNGLCLNCHSAQGNRDLIRAFDFY
jgi:hypothetical protein